MGRDSQYEALHRLTEREREVLDLLRDGLSDAESAIEPDFSGPDAPAAMSAPSRGDELTTDDVLLDAPAAQTPPVVPGDDSGAVTDEPPADDDGATPTATPPPPMSPPESDEPTPAPTAHDTILCVYPDVPPGWLYVYFWDTVSDERAAEIAQEVDGTLVPVDVMIAPIAIPTPNPGEGERAEVVEVPVDEVAMSLVALETYDEVSWAESIYWTGCP
jgi:hypothetical protein